MTGHLFLLQPHNWLGEGKIKLSMVEEELNFYTRWNLGSKTSKGEIPALQEVQIKGMAEVMNNQFLITNLTETQFNIELENTALGVVAGKGLIKDNLIAWEFRDNDLGFEGFEFYERQDDGTYLMRAEYSTPDQYRTVIRGVIRQKLDSK